MIFFSRLIRTMDKQQFKKEFQQERSKRRKKFGVKERSIRASFYGCIGLQPEME